MKIKFTRNVLVYSIHREAGTVHEIKDNEAILLIAERSAVKVDSATIETAEAPTQQRESATIQTPKGKKGYK